MQYNFEITEPVSNKYYKKVPFKWLRDEGATESQNLHQIQGQNQNISVGFPRSKTCNKSYS